MFSSGASGERRGTQPSGNSPTTVGSTSALMAANMKMKRKTQTSPKAMALSQQDQAVMKPQGAAVAGQTSSLKQYATAAQQASQQNFPDKYSTKTRNKIGQAISVQQPGLGPHGNSDSVSSGNGGQPAMYPAAQANSRKLQSSQQNYKSYSSNSPKMANQTNQAGKLLFAQSAHHPAQHQSSQAAIQTAGMQGFEESQKRQEIISQTQQQLMAIRNNQNYLMRNNGASSKKDLMRSEEYAGRPPTSQLSQSRLHMAGQGVAVAGEGPTTMAQHSGNPGSAMSQEYYSRNPRTLTGNAKSPDPQTQSQQALHIQQQQSWHQQQNTQSSSAQRQMTKTGGIGVTGNFMKRRVSEEKAVELNAKVNKPTLAASRSNAISYQEYLDHSKARSPKLYTSKQLEQYKQQTQQQNAQMAQTQMFNGRTVPGRAAQVTSQTKQYQYGSNSAGKQIEASGPTAGMVYSQSQASTLAAGKSRNTQMAQATSHGSLGNKYKSQQTGTKPSSGYALSPKAMAMSRDSQNSKHKFGLKGSPKLQTSPTAGRIAPSLSSQGGLFGNEAGRNMQTTSIRSKHSGNSSGQIQYIRGSAGQAGGSNGMGLSPTAQYKKVLMKGPMQLMAGKVLEDNDDDEDDYEDDDIDEQSPHITTNMMGAGRHSNDDGVYAPQTSQQREKEQQQLQQQQQQQRAVRSQTQREQYQKQQRRLLRNIWIYTEKGNCQACYDLLTKQDPKLAQALLNECNSDGWTPLHVASNEGHVEMIDIFARFGAHLDCKAKNLRTPLHVACIRGNGQVLQALLNQGADYDAKDCDGNTPCHMVSQYGHTQCLRVLLEKHPKLVTKNKDGVSPMDVAYNKEILAIFQDYINRVQNIFASQQSSSKYSTSSHGSGQGAANMVNTTGITAGARSDGASSKVPNSLSKPERKNSDAQLPQRLAGRPGTSGAAQPEEQAAAAATLQHKQNQARLAKQQQQIINEKAVQSANAHREQAAAAQAQQPAARQSASQPKSAQAQNATINNKAQNKNVQIHDSLNKHGDGKEKKSRNGHEQADKEEVSSSNQSSQHEEETRRVGPDDFMPLKILGSGSFGEVYLVREIRTEELFAMKVLTKAKIFGNNLVRYAKTERDVLSYTKHPFIVGLNYAFQTETKLFLILDFCPGGDLGRVLQREGRLNEERARKYLCEVLLAIEALHKRDIIFRDLKPDNVVIDTDGHACLTDFGLSKEGVFDPSRGAKSFCGSVAYLAPEMIRKAGHGKSVDWYLLGVLLYEMIVGQPPYFSESKDQLFNNIQRGVLKLPVSMSQEAKNLIVHLLNRNPSKRLGAGSGGANEIKSHPFFKDIDWDEILARRVPMPAPRYTCEQFKRQYEAFNCTEEQKRQIFEDSQAQESSRNDRVEGWSFVQRDEPAMQDVILNQAQVELNEGRAATEHVRRQEDGAAQTQDEKQ